MPTINWTIQDMRWDANTGGVFRVKWLCWASEDGVDATKRGTCDFFPDTSDSGFVDLQSLTEDTVVGWVKDNVNVAEIEAAVALILQNSKTPKEESGLPW